MTHGEVSPWSGGFVAGQAVRRATSGHRASKIVLRPGGHYLLFYEVEADFIQKRAQYRTKHLALAWQAHEKGELLLAGALDERIDTAVLLFQAASPGVAEQFTAA
jgi:uncharacterized protein YciI